MKAIGLLSLNILLVCAKPVFDNTVFSDSVYNALDESGNFVLSPFSLQTILALTEAGAVGSTAEELRKGLFLPSSEEDVESTFKSLLPQLQNEDFVLNLANKVYVQDGWLVKDRFQAVAEENYQASLQSVDFGQSATVDEINGWVSGQTSGKIQEIVNGDEFDEDTRMVLVNALYLQGNWTTQFDSNLTTKRDFYKSRDAKTESEMMFLEAALLDFYESDDLDAKLIQLPFGTEASLVVVLPNEVEGIDVLEKGAKFVPATFKKELVQVVLPKFKIETSVDFRAVLPNLGISQAFSPQFADFSDIAGSKGELYISKINQKTVIDVSESGLEGAAATVVEGNTDVVPQPAQHFVADHPFVFFVKVKDVIVLEGRVLVPEY